MKNRAGQLWEEWHGGDWQYILVVHTEREGYDVRIHTCLNIDTGVVKQKKETFQDIWESTPTENVYNDHGYHSFAYIMRRRRVEL